MYAKKIIFPTDFSSASDAALMHATSVAKDTGATLIIAHVEEPMTSYIGEGYYGVPNPPNPEVRRMLEAIQPADPRVRFEHRLLTGEPAEAIVRLAKDERADLIVMGTHGRTFLGRLLMGSVAEAVVRTAECPVLTFKQPHSKAGQAK
jgi:nucleotide-binding universal stress UspA family protein